MKQLAITLLSISLIIFACKTGPGTAGKAELKTNMDSVSYFIGTDIGRSLNEIKDELDFDLVWKGLCDHSEGKEVLLTKEVMQPVMRTFSMEMRKRQEEKRVKTSKENLEKGKKFLEENKAKEGIVTTESGLQYKVIRPGGGPKPTEKDRVKVHYKGTTLDGTEFDSSYKRGQPATFGVTSVIKGWTEALLMMKVGSKYRLFIPAELAYGERGQGQKIPPNSMLIFEVELIGIE